jgi:hypothetical protein
MEVALMFRHWALALTALNLIVPQASWACATNVKGHKNKVSWKAYFEEHRKVDKVARKPADLGRLPYSELEPWGGPEKTNWKPEAVLANAVSQALNDGFSDSNVKDVLVSLPVQMRYSGNDRRVYGDGQTNAAVDLGDGWVEKEPILIASLWLFKNGQQKVKFQFHKTLKNVEGRGLEISYGGKTKKIDPGIVTSEGHFVFEWKPTSDETPKWGDLFGNRVAFVRPVGWNDWFPIDFRDVVRPASELLEQVPADKRALGKGTLLDPEGVSVQGKDGDAIPFFGMKSESFGAVLKGERYFPVPSNDEPKGIHNVFSNGRATAVGRGFTTVYQAPPASLAPFKMAYICFDKRDREAEAKYGVPSGGGWHEIGDEAETVLNTLERAPVIFGYANGKPAAAPPSGTFSYGLSDVAVIRLLQPGSAIVSSAGPKTYAEDTVDGFCLNAPSRGQGGPEGRSYHWFVFHHPHEVCAVEWVHPNIPSPTNQLGFKPMNRTGCRYR